eukprot:3662853-Prymnesium_polylepis.1
MRRPAPPPAQRRGRALAGRRGRAAAVRRGARAGGGARSVLRVAAGAQLGRGDRRRAAAPLLLL